MRERRILLRPARYIVAPFAAAGVAVSVLILARVVAAGQDPWQAGVGSALVVAALVVAINYIWFHYVILDADGIYQVKYLGLVRRSIPLRDLTGVATRPIDTSFGIMRPAPSVRFCLGQGVIELGQTYPPGPLKEAITLVKERGIPVDKKLLNELNIE